MSAVMCRRREVDTRQPRSGRTADRCTRVPALYYITSQSPAAGTTLHSLDSVAVEIIPYGEADSNAVPRPHEAHLPTMPVLICSATRLRSHPP